MPSRNTPQFALVDLPPLPDGWHYRALSTLLEPDRTIAYGIVQPGPATEGGVPIVRVQDIQDGTVDRGGPLRVSSGVAERYRRTRLRGGELLVTLVGTVGMTAVAPSDISGWNVARAIGVVPVQRDIGSSFVRYALQLPELQELMTAWCNTTVQATLNLKELAQVPVPVPPRAERERITALLVSLDDKIALNRRMSRTLDAIAESLFRSWFVDFDPVTAKSEERRAIGIPDALHDAMPKRFRDQGGEQIPEGWRICALRDLLSLAYGKSLPERARRSGAVPVFGSDGTTGWHDEPLVSGPGVIVGRKGNAGRVNWSDEPFFPIDTTYYVEPRDPQVPLVYAFYMLRALNLEALTGDSAVPGLNRELAYSLTALRPEDRVMRAFGEFATPIRRHIASNERENRTLATLRDTLLPQLLSGAIRLHQAEHAVARAI